MSNEGADVTLAEMLDAFMHPPRVVPVGHRSESANGEIRIVSHVELWPWRVVVRGVRADKHAEPITVPNGVGTSPAERWSGVGPVTGAATVSIVHGQPPERQRRQHEWFMAWSISDDLGTEYPQSGAGGGGSGGVAWSDFDIRFDTPVPADARALTLHPPEGDEIVVSLGVSTR